MAWPGGDTAAVISPSAGAPLFLYKNIAEGTVASSGLWTQGGLMASTDYSDEDFPTVAAWDGFGHVPTKPLDSAPAANTWYLNLQPAASASFGISGIAVIGHNFAEVSGGVDVTVEIAKDAAFSTNLTEVHDFGTVTSAERLAAQLSTSYLAATYVRLKMVSNAGGSWSPQIGEFVVGPTTFLSNGPIKPFDDLGYATEVDVIESKSGAEVRYHRFDGQLNLPYRILFESATDLANVRTMERATRGGARSVVLFPAPVSLASRGYLVTLPAGFSAPNVFGPAVREVNLSCTELPPFRASEV